MSTWPVLVLSINLGYLVYLRTWSTVLDPNPAVDQCLWPTNASGPPMSLLTNVSVDQCICWPMSLLTNVSVDQCLCWPMSLLINVSVDQCLCWPISLLTNVSGPPMPLPYQCLCPTNASALPMTLPYPCLWPTNVSVDQCLCSLSGLFAGAVANEVR